MRISNTDAYYEDSIAGQPQVKYGVGAVDGDAAPFVSMPIGSKYIRNGAGFVHEYTKVKNDSTDNDWTGGMNVLRQSVVLADFTDSTGATGTLALDGTIPAGAVVVRCIVTDVVAFAGDSTSVLIIGYSGATAAWVVSGGVSVQSNIAMLDGGIPATPAVAAVKTPLLTITEDDDFTDITTGSMTVSIYYLY